MERKPLKNSSSVPLKSVSIFKQTSFRLIIGILLLVTIIITFALIITHVTNEEFYLINTEVTVLSDYSQCDKMGLNMIRRGGSAVDAIVAAQLCLGVTFPHLTGIGGFGVMIIHNHITKESNVLDFTDGMLSKQTPAKKESPMNNFAVPGVLKGLETAHKKYGKLPWAMVVLSVAQLAGGGFFMTQTLYNALQATPSIVKDLDTVFMFNGSLIEIGEKVQWDEMARTLENLARTGADGFYSGDYANEFIRSLPEGTLSMEDLSSYLCKEQQPLETIFNGWVVRTPQNPVGGLELHNGLEYFKNCNCTIEDDLAYFTKLTKILKSTRSGMNQTGRNSESEGVSILAIDGEELIVSLVSGLGGIFGSKIIANGNVIMNAGIDSSAELNRTGSWMSPAILFKKGEICGPRGAVASTDYQMVLQVVMNLLRGKNVISAVEMPRYEVLSESGDITVEASGVDYEDVLEIMATRANKSEGKLASANAFVKVKDQIVSSKDQRFGG